ncbi:MAG: hypothetical protein WC314_01545 [Vulcanimicrobiota bacterium]
MSSLRKGFAIATVMMVLGILAIITTALVAVGSGNLQTSFMSLRSDKAYYAAEGGGQAALWELSRNSAWTGFTPAVQELPNSECTYKVETFREGGPSPPNGVIVPPGLVYVLSTGTYDDFSRQIGLMVRTEVGTLDYAAVAHEKITVQGGSSVTSRDPVTNEVLPQAANIATNGIQDGAITVQGGSTVVGNADAGLGAASTSIVVEGGSNVEGTRGNLSAPVPMDPVVLPADPSGAAPAMADAANIVNLTPGVYGDVTSQGGAEMILAPGEYTFKSLTLQGGGQFAITGPTTIYIQSDVTIMTGAVVNPSKVPTDLKFLVEDGTVTVQQGGLAYYVLYAPTSSVVYQGGSTVYGNLIGNDLTIQNGSHLFFDPASSGAATEGGSTTAMVVSHQRF